MTTPGEKTSVLLCGLLIASCSHRSTAAPPPATAEQPEPTALELVRRDLARVGQFVDAFPTCSDDTDAVRLDDGVAMKRPGRKRIRAYLVASRAGCTEAWCSLNECCNSCGGIWGVSSHPRGPLDYRLSRASAIFEPTWSTVDCAAEAVRALMPVVEVIVTGDARSPIPKGDPYRKLFGPTVVYSALCVIRSGPTAQR